MDSFAASSAAFFPASIPATVLSTAARYSRFVRTVGIRIDTTRATRVPVGVTSHDANCACAYASGGRSREN